MENDKHILEKFKRIQQETKTDPKKKSKRYHEMHKIIESPYVKTLLT